MTSYREGGDKTPPRGNFSPRTVRPSSSSLLSASSSSGQPAQLRRPSSASPARSAASSSSRGGLPPSSMNHHPYPPSHNNNKAASTASSGAGSGFSMTSAMETLSNIASDVLKTTTSATSTPMKPPRRAQHDDPYHNSNSNSNDSNDMDHTPSRAGSDSPNVMEAFKQRLQETVAGLSYEPKPFTKPVRIPRTPDRSLPPTASSNPASATKKSMNANTKPLAHPFPGSTNPPNPYDNQRSRTTSTPTTNHEPVEDRIRMNSNSSSAAVNNTDGDDGLSFSPSDEQFPDPDLVLSHTTSSGMLRGALFLKPDNDTNNNNNTDRMVDLEEDDDDAMRHEILRVDDDTTQGRQSESEPEPEVDEDDVMDDEVAAFASTKPRSSEDDEDEWTDPNITASAALWPNVSNPGSAFVPTPPREHSHNANTNPHHQAMEDNTSFPHSASPTWDGVVPRPTSGTVHQDPRIRASNNSTNATLTPPRPPHRRGPGPPQSNHSTMENSTTPNTKGSSASMTRSSPMARMRDTQVRSVMSLPPGSELDPSLDAEGQPREEPAAVAPQETKQEISGDDFVADKHRKWRRKMIVAAEQEKAQLEGDGSVGSDRRRNRRNEGAVTITSSPLAFVQQIFSKNCLAYDTKTPSSNYSDNDDGASYYTDDEDDEEDEDDDSEESENEESEDEDYDRGRSPRSRHELYTNAADNAAQSSSSKHMPEKAAPPEIVLESFIKQMSQTGVPLMWHKRVANETATISHPTSVRAFLQLGAVDESTDVFKGPRLIWDKVESVKEKMGKAALPHGISNRSGNLDLLDILSIDKAGIMDLKEYPFAIPGTSFFLNFSGGDPLLFETSSEFEQDRVVNGIRQLVARLSFELIMGNNKGVCKTVISLQGINIPDSLNDVQDLLVAKAVSDITNELVEKTLQKCIPTDYYGRVV